MSGDFFLRNSASEHLSRLDNIRFGSFRHRVAFAFVRMISKFMDGMAHIIGMRDILQIGMMVIGFVPVHMVYFMTVWARSYKGRSDYLVNFQREKLSILIKCDLQIAASIDGFSKIPKLHWAATARRHALNISTIRNNIVIFPAYNWTPFSHGVDDTYCCGDAQ